jgi:hypothetical protein
VIAWSSRFTVVSWPAESIRIRVSISSVSVSRSAFSPLALISAPLDQPELGSRTSRMAGGAGLQHYNKLRAWESLPAA